jgi:putative endopeptidase
MALSFVLAACGQGKPTVESDEKTAASPEKYSGIYVENMNPNVRPGDDFNAYVNGSWMDSAEIAADRASNSVGLEVHERSQASVKVIVDESASGDFAKGTDEQKVGDLYNSYLDMETRNGLGMTPLQADFAAIEALENYEQLAVYFATANKVRVGLPFSLGQGVDYKNPKSYMMHTNQGGLGLPEREFYFEEGDKSKEIRDAYVAHIATMFELANLPAGEAAADTIMALETRIAAEHMKKELTRDRVLAYNKIPLSELPDLMPNFAWDAYLAEAGIDDIDGLVVMQLDYMRALDSIITETSMVDWKTYLTWHVLTDNAHLLTEELDQENFAFYATTLNGIEERLPRWKRALNNVNSSLGEVVGKVYVTRHFPPAAKERMMELVGNLIRAYDASIRELDWMGEETKKEALDKLSKFTPKIGYTDVWKNYDALVIEPHDLVGNLHRSARFGYDYDVARQGGDVDRSEWFMTPQTVNAYFYPPLNEIVFPAAILQPPFFDLGAEDAVNYGAIGAIIGHEIGHGFDDSGSTFDGDGVLRDWWTDEDKAEFEARTAKLVDQYSAFRPFDDLNVNGEYTLGENIGDLGGLSIALLAYKMSLNGAEPPTMDGFTGAQRVFIGYAQAWRGISRDEAVRNQINTDPHSPRQYRVNGVVRNVPEFYDAFDVAETDALYLAPEDRVKIW